MTFTLRTAYVPLTSLRAAPSNPREGHDIPSLIAAFRQFGFIDPPLVDDRTMRLVGGHGRQEALVELRERGDFVPRGIMVDDDGDWLVPVTRGWESRDDAEAAAALVGLNQITMNAGWHRQGVARLLEQISTERADLLDATGFHGDSIDQLLGSVQVTDLGVSGTEDNPTIGATPPVGQSEDAPLDEPAGATRGDVQCPGCGHIFPLSV